MSTNLSLIVAATLLVSPMAVSAAPTCDQFKSAITEGAAQYQAAPPNFRLEHVNSVNPDNRFISIAMFDDERPAFFLCSHGEVEAFAADAKNNGPLSVLHTMLLAGMALHGYGLEWRQALETRDRLVSLAKASDRQMSEIHIGGGKVSLVISMAGLPSFRIDTER
jgi:hypothetical protein